MVACGSETNDTTDVGGNHEIVSDSENEPVVTEAPAVEPEVTPAPAEVTPEPTEEPEATAAPTEEPNVVYEGIDMNSTLPGQEWLETFIGVIDEPKVVVFNDNTGKKVIVEQEGEVTFNPDEDAIAIFLPAGYYDGNASQGVAINSNKSIIKGENYTIFYLDSEKMREVEKSKAGFLVMKGDERVVLIANLKIE